MYATINGQEYQLRDYQPFGYTDILTLYIINYDSIDALVETIGESAVVSVPDECVWNEAILDHIVRFWDSGIPTLEVAFKPFPYEKTIRDHNVDIEVMSQAITELAEIIGGDE